MGFRNAIKIAAVALIVSRVVCLIEVIGIPLYFSGPRWAGIAGTAFEWLLQVPLVVAMVLLWRTRARFALSPGLRRLALGAAIVLGLFSTLPCLLGCMQMVARIRERLQLFYHPVLFDRLLDWARHDGLWPCLDLIVALLASAALVWLLLAFYRHSIDEPDAPLPTSLLRAFALGATLVSAFVVVRSIGTTAYNAIVYRNDFGNPWAWLQPSLNQTLTRFLVHNAIAIIPSLCVLMACWLIYRGLSAPAPVVTESDDLAEAITG